MANNCQECGCVCRKCTVTDHEVHLHVEIENLKQRLAERDNHIVTMETNFLKEAGKFPSGEVLALREELLIWQDKYRRLNEAHKRVQRVNQGLEDKLLKLVDVCETDKNALTKDVAGLSHKLAEANYTIKKLTEDNERYKSDVALAIQFLQCKQSNFVSQKFDSLPAEVQNQVSNYMSTKRKQPEDRKQMTEAKSIKVPIPTFPPTAMVYSVPKSPNPSRKNDDRETNQPVDIVSAAIMAKVLEERERERSLIKHCDTCSCASKKIVVVTSDKETHNIGVQTDFDFDGISKVSNILLDGYESLQKTKTNNIVKVEPNNFLRDENASSNNSSMVNLTKSTSEINLIQLNDPIPPQPIINTHHHLCNKSNEKPIVEPKIEKSSNDSPKGPRYCSMRLQSGSKNILLDNTHSNVPPILYTRHQKSGKPPNESCGSSVISDASEGRNRQRTAEWIERSSEGVGSSPEGKVDSTKYAEMESNVKKFLFGDAEFLKTVEKGKAKYENFRQQEEVAGSVVAGSRSNSHTETDI